MGIPHLNAQQIAQGSGFVSHYITSQRVELPLLKIDRKSRASARFFRSRGEESEGGMSMQLAWLDD
jgi:hypothetical protein